MTEEQKNDFPGYNTLAFTSLPDEFFDWQMQDLNLSELKALLYIFRRTFGFKKCGDRISLSQFMEGIIKKNGNRLDRGSGLASRSSLISGLRALEKRGYIKSGFYCGSCGAAIDPKKLITETRNRDEKSFEVQVVPEKCIECGRQLRGREEKFYFLNIRGEAGVVRQPYYPWYGSRTTPSTAAVLTRYSIQDTDQQEEETSEDFSDLLSPRERHHEPSPYDLAFAEKKASMTTKQFESWLSLGGGPQLRQEMGEAAWTTPVDATTDELDGDFLVAEFCAHLEIDPKVLPTKTKKAWKRQLTKPAVERNIPFEGALKALRFTLNFQIGPLDWMRRGGYDPIISRPAHPKFLESYESMLLKEASGTLESFIERRQKSGVRSSSGQSAQGGGPSEDARRRGAAFDVVTERRRREAEQEMLLLRGAPDPSA